VAQRRDKQLITRREFQRSASGGGRLALYSWLICELLLYLTGFLKRRNRPETAKILQKVARSEHGCRAFTIRALTMPRRLTGFTMR
jgi:hypothetical protein